MRQFDTGAIRDSEEGKPDYEGYLSPTVLACFGAYMLRHQTQADGSLRNGDNWQKGIPRSVYMKSGFRHFMEWWRIHRNGAAPELLNEALCALLFNVMGYLHEHLKEAGADDKLEQFQKNDWSDNTCNRPKQPPAEMIIR